MNVNLPVWSYYQKGFVHPDFVPYMRYSLEEGVCETDLNTWKVTAGGSNPTIKGPGVIDYRFPTYPPKGMVNPALIRKNWNWSFQLKHPDDPAPPGWHKDPGTGWCYREEPEFEPVFYTEKAFLPKYQFWSGYAPAKTKPRTIVESTDLKSVNPLTGLYEVYYAPSQYTGSSADRNRYGSNPTRDGLI